MKKLISIILTLLLLSIPTTTGCHKKTEAPENLPASNITSVVTETNYKIDKGSYRSVTNPDTMIVFYSILNPDNNTIIKLKRVQSDSGGLMYTCVFGIVSNEVKAASSLWTSKSKVFDTYLYDDGNEGVYGVEILYKGKVQLMLHDPVSDTVHINFEDGTTLRFSITKELWKKATDFILNTNL